MTARPVGATIRSLAVDVRLGQVCLAVFMVCGFGVVDLSAPWYGRGMAALGVAVVVLAPRRAWEQIPLSVPIQLLLAWWLLSYTWAPTARPWAMLTWRTIPALFALIAVAATVPFARAAGGLLTGCYVAMGWSLLALAIDPTAATTNPDGTVGWRGSFTHRNHMGMFLALVFATIATLERRRPWKVVGLTVCLGMLIMTRSVTSLLTALAVAGTGAWLWKYRALEGRQAAVFATTTIAIGALALALTVARAPVILPLLGKDVSLTGRTRVWHAVWGAVEASPLVGYGVGVWLERSRPPVADVVREVGWYPYHSHNGLLELLFRLGAVGAALYLAVVLQTVVGAWRRFSQHPDLNRWALLVAVVMITTAISESTVLGPWLALLAYAQTASRAAALRESVSES